ncbi:Synerg-CTERM sorting domain-containing protein [uncultured Fretibacterium sp.]
MTPETDSKSGSGGGCDAGVSGLALALVGAFLLRRKV